MARLLPLTEEQKEKAVYQKYEARVEELIRERYTISQELAILRQREIKYQEFESYNKYCEECKKKAKEEILR